MKLSNKVILFTLCLILIFSCQKESKTSSKQIKLSSFNAKEALNSYLNFKKSLNNTNLLNSTISTNSLKTNIKKDIPFIILDDTPYESNTRDYSFVEFKIKYKFDTGLIPDKGTLEENQKFRDLTLNKLLIKKNKKSGIIDYELIAYIPAKNYLNNPSNIKDNFINKLNPDFQGFILHKNIGGENILLENIINGVVEKKMYPQRNTNARLKVSGINTISATYGCGQICYYTPYYDDFCRCWVDDWQCFTGCEPTSYPGVSLDNGMLAFDSNQAFDDMLNQLDNEYENYNASFFDSRDNMTDDEINDYADQIGFDEFKPLKDFENYFGFSSLRQSIEIQTNNWMDNIEADACSSPMNTASIDDETEQTLFNTSNQVKIAGVTYTINSSSSASCPINDVCSPTTPSSCVFTHKTTKEKPFSDNKLIWEKLKLDGEGTPIGGDHSQFILRPQVKAKIIFYKIKNNGGRRRYATRLSVRIYGNLYNTQDGGAGSPNCMYREYLDTGHNPQRRRYRRKNVERWGIYTQSKYCELNAEYKIQSSTVSLSLQP